MKRWIWPFVLCLFLLPAPSLADNYNYAVRGVSGELVQLALVAPKSKEITAEDRLAVNVGILAGGAVAPGGSWDLLDEDFEGAGAPSGWNEEVDCDTIEYDYPTNGGVALAGSESLYLADDDSVGGNGYCQISSPSFTAQDELWIKYILRLDTNSNSYSMLRFRTATPTSEAGLYNDTEESAVSLNFYHGATDDDEWFVYSLSTPYYVWVHYDEAGNLDWEVCTSPDQTGCTSGDTTGNGAGGITKLWFSIGHGGASVTKIMAVDNVQASSGPCVNGFHWDTCP